MDLSIIIVNWNTKKLLKECLLSIKKETNDISFEIIVVDNGSTDGSIEMIKANFQNVKLIANKSNLGYSRSNNLAIKECCGKYVCLLNSDTVILQNALGKLFNFLEINKNAGAVSCQLLNENGTLQFSTAYGEVDLIHVISVETGLYKKYPKSKIWGKPLLSYLDRTKTQEIDVCPSVAILIRRKILKRIGFLDEKIFFGTIDWDLSNRIRLNGWKLFFYPHARIIHYGGKSKDPIKRDLLIKDYNARYYYFKKHYGSFKMYLYKLFIIQFSVLKICFFSILCLLKYKEADSLIYFTLIKEYFLRLCVSFGYRS